MKKLLLLLLLIALALTFVACNKDSGEENSAANDTSPINYSLKIASGELGSFAAVTPSQGAVLTEIPTFSWNSAQNADSYTLEICTSDKFEFDENGVYICKVGIQSTEFNLAANLKKNTTYYWRVTAENKDDFRYFDEECLSFYYKAFEHSDIAIDVGYADEWSVHEKGSAATVSLEADFFQKDQNALRVYFEREDTQRGEEFVENNGWIVVTHSLESEFYGLDAFYFNFYYMGNDAKAYFRLIDEDNEYWYAPIKLAMNTKQEIVLRLSDFVLRTNGTPVVNKTFDSYYLKDLELVFERVDGDGVAYFGNLHAIRFADFADQFIDEVDFRRFVVADPEVEGQYFTFSDVKAEEEGKALTYTFQVNQEVDAKIKEGELSTDFYGYSFIKIPIDKMVTGGEAFSLEVDTSQIEDKSWNFMMRVVEEDNDVWSFLIKLSDIPEDGKLIIPFAAFNIANGGAKGDGAKQFYRIKRFMFGQENCYVDGTVTIRNLKICDLTKALDDVYTIKVENGVIEDFDEYRTTVDVYYKWEPSTVNKDESMKLVDAGELGVRNKAVCFYYKTDLTEAYYRTSFTPVSDYNAIEIWAKDLPKDGAKGEMIVYLISDGRYFACTLTELSDEWTSYVIPFSMFKVAENSYGAVPESSNKIDGVALAFQYYFANPKYATGSSVEVDLIRFTNVSDQEKKESRSGVIEPISYSSESKKGMIGSFEDELSTGRWYVYDEVVGGKDSNDFNKGSAIDLSSDSASGSGKSLSLSYATQLVSPYAANFAVDHAMSAKGLTLLLKGDGKVGTTLEVLLYTANVTYKTTMTIEDEWHYYSIGFDHFLSTAGNAKFDAGKVATITKVALLIKNYDGQYPAYSSGTLLMDEIYFDNAIALSDKK